MHRLVVSEVNPWAFFKLVDKASYRLGLWLQFLFPRMRYLYLTRIVSASGGLSYAVFLQYARTVALRLLPWWLLLLLLLLLMLMLPFIGAA